MNDGAFRIWRKETKKKTLLKCAVVNWQNDNSSLLLLYPPTAHTHMELLDFSNAHAKQNSVIIMMQKIFQRIFVPCICLFAKTFETHWVYEETISMIMKMEMSSIFCYTPVSFVDYTCTAHGLRRHRLQNQYEQMENSQTTQMLLWNFAYVWRE